MKSFSLLLILTSAMCAAQTTPVVPLSAEDAAMVKRIHQEMLDAEKHWQDLQSTIRDRYLIVDKGDPQAGEEKYYPPLTGTWFTSSRTSLYTIGTDECSPTYRAERARVLKEQEAAEKEAEAKARRYRKGWSQSKADGFQYSDDWKYLLPGPSEAPKQNFWITPSGPLLGGASPIIGSTN